MLALCALCAASAASSEAKPSQVLLLGPHHSATSIASRALGLLGLYLGKEEDLLLEASNPLKFWERRGKARAPRSRITSFSPRTCPAASCSRQPRLPVAHSPPC